MLAEPSYNSREAREKMVQLMFEKYDVPGAWAGVRASSTGGVDGPPPRKAFANDLQKLDFSAVGLPDWAVVARA